jgi:hypothetical protein
MANVAYDSGMASPPSFGLPQGLNITHKTTANAHVVTFPKQPKQMFVAVVTNVYFKWTCGAVAVWLIIFLSILAARPAFIVQPVFQSADQDGKPRFEEKASASKAAIMALMIVLAAVAVGIAVLIIVNKKNAKNKPAAVGENSTA